MPKLVNEWRLSLVFLEKNKMYPDFCKSDVTQDTKVWVISMPLEKNTMLKPLNVRRLSSMSLEKTEYHEQLMEVDIHIFADQLALASIHLVNYSVFSMMNLFLPMASEIIPSRSIPHVTNDQGLEMAWMDSASV
ncbi:hypothetical protein V6N12_031037 [Hibiscus sabdariffa]|uniref:Uncharacterized protein n=1 Tax=Hibiscus sabdariffa TaxID=183260 RepID=A0ABR2E866_9ROSI